MLGRPLLAHLNRPRSVAREHFYLSAWAEWAGRVPFLSKQVARPGHPILQISLQEIREGILALYCHRSASSRDPVKMALGGNTDESAQRLIFSDIPNDRRMACDVSARKTEVFRHPPTSPMATRATGKAA
jgi:hypothetical protein